MGAAVVPRREKGGGQARDGAAGPPLSQALIGPSRADPERPALRQSYSFTAFAKALARSKTRLRTLPSVMR